MTDKLTKFIFDDGAVRGELVELQATWQTILKHRHYPTPVQNLLGELTAAAALLCANLKFNGSMILQIHGDGAIQLLVVECNNQLQLRSTVKLLKNAPISANANLTELVNAHGHGRFVITLDPSDKSSGQQPYQGIIPLQGKNIAAVIENYMRLSEQLDTKLWLAANGQVSRGMLLQRLPDKSDAMQQEDHQDTWQRACLLGNTLGAEELLNTYAATLMHRLFWQETLRVFDAQPVSYACTCNRGKVSHMLTMLGKAEVTEAVTSLGKLEIHCDFCGKPYYFDAVDCAQLFLAPEQQVHSNSSQRH
jgi:molecular chaperone Hsp33